MNPVQLNIHYQINGNYIFYYISITVNIAFIFISVKTNITGADPGFDQGGAPDRDRPKTAILGPQFCRILVLGPHFWWSGGARAPPLDLPLH